MPWRQVHLGLDLRGGSYLLLQVDMDAVARSGWTPSLDRARQPLTGKYRALTQPPGEAACRITLRDPAQARRRSTR